MNDQKDLFGDQPPAAPYGGHPPYQKHSATSKQAAAQIKDRLGPMHKAIIEALTRRGARGATDEELMAELDMGGNTERPRRRELQLMGRIEDAEITRLARSGRNATVWRLKQS
jgi:hypothetical protein